MSRLSPYKVLIVGAGKIGAFFDTPQDEHVLTHAHAFKANENFSIEGFVDADLSQAKEAARIWGGLGFSNIISAYKSLDKIDVVVIASPDDTHASLFIEICQYSPKLIFIEKPLGKTSDEMRRMIEIAHQKKVAVLVNYIRRFVKEIQVLREEISRGLYGNFITGTGYYGKGVLHNASHMIDLLRFLIGDIKDGKLVSFVYDFYKDDPSVSAFLSFDKGESFLMQAIDCRMATIFEIDLFFEKERIRIVDAGRKIEKFNLVDDLVFSGYKIFQAKEILQSSFDQAFVRAVENIEEYLMQGKILLCSIQDGHKAAEVSLSLINQIEEK